MNYFVIFLMFFTLKPIKHTTITHLANTKRCIITNNRTQNIPTLTNQYLYMICKLINEFQLPVMCKAILVYNKECYISTKITKVALFHLDFVI